MKKSVFVFFLLAFALAVNADARLPLTPAYKVYILGPSGSLANALNNHGIVAGQVATPIGAKAAIFTKWGWQELFSPAMSQALGINNLGVVAGFVLSEDQTSSTPMVWRKGSWKALPFDGYYGFAYDINDASWVVGGAMGPKGTFAILWRLPYASSIILDGGTDSYYCAYAINDRGQIVGEAKGQACRWWQNQRTFLKTPPGFRSLATDINNRGEIVGWVTKPQTYVSTPVRWSNRKITFLRTLGGYGYAYGINDAGLIVGVSTFCGRHHACLWEKDKMYDLNDLITSGPTIEILEARAINARADIVGLAITEDGQTHAVLLRRVYR